MPPVPGGTSHHSNTIVIKLRRRLQRHLLERRLNLSRRKCVCQRISCLRRLLEHRRCGCCLPSVRLPWCHECHTGEPLRFDPHISLQHGRRRVQRQRDETARLSSFKQRRLRQQRRCRSHLSSPQYHSGNTGQHESASSMHNHSAQR